MYYLHTENSDYLNHGYLNINEPKGYIVSLESYIEGAKLIATADHFSCYNVSDEYCTQSPCGDSIARYNFSNGELNPLLACPVRKAAEADFLRLFTPTD